MRILKSINFLRIYALVAVMPFAVLGCSSSGDTTEPPANTAPEAPNSPLPEHNSTTLPGEVVLHWSSGDANGDSLTFSVFLDTVDPPAARIATAISARSFTIDQLTGNRVYYWKVDASDGTDVCSGPVWRFSTSNRSPEPPHYSYPDSGSANLAIDTSMTWHSSDPDGDVLEYDVYLDTQIGPPWRSAALVSSTQQDTTYSTRDLRGNCTYYWQVVARDGNSTSPGPVWTFSTEVRHYDLPMVAIAAGSFTMGSPVGESCRYSDGRETQRAVTVTRGFDLMATEVTEELWDDVMGTGASTSLSPIAHVSWGEAIEFCNALSRQEGLTEAYAIVSETVTWDRMATGYCLPTEAEWEYACRAGTTSAFCNGTILSCMDAPNLGLVAWYGGGNVHEVGTKEPNAWGLYDMHGNVAEICWDVYQTNTPGGNDPNGQFDHVLAQPYWGTRTKRGGSVSDNPGECRSASRATIGAGSTGSDGFRIARKTAN